MSTTVTLDIASIGAGGVGVARADGRVVFVPRTAPGERIEATLEPAASDARFLNGRLTRVLAPGPDRVAPACPHYDGDDCGGCQLQHLTEEAQQRAKVGIITDAFQRIAKRPLAAPPALQAGPSPWRYRRALSLHFRPDGAHAWHAGMHAYHAPGTIFALSDCLITREGVVAALRAVVDAGAHLPAWNGLRITARETPAGIALLIEGAEVWDEGGAQRLLEAVPALAAIWWHPHRGRRRLVADRRVQPEPGASFAQVNAEVAELLRAHLLARVRAFRPRTVVDAYAGAGDTAVPLAQDGARVTAIELDAEASRWCASRLPAG
ncbi:MAG: class I SAM-dependent RNA methyltransferase, partial [Gemmatimonadetes bacterium]|nr:class I SAM-dependent RNA methyltransferase [Gemmatimonadota bacterium]